jgi:hypothetical protein
MALVSNKLWESKDVKEAVAALISREDGGEPLPTSSVGDTFYGDRRYVLSPQPAAPVTYAFRTSEGTVGLLQILEFKSKPEYALRAQLKVLTTSDRRRRGDHTRAATEPPK